MDGPAGSVRWYFWDMKDTIMSCGFCVEDDEWRMHMPVRRIVKLPQAARCQHCGWIPKVQGLARPV